MTTESHKRTLVKTVIHRIWILITTYVLLRLNGDSWNDAVMPTILINLFWTGSYYMYERIWNNIEWGKNG